MIAWHLGPPFPPPLPPPHFHTPFPYQERKRYHTLYLLPIPPSFHVRSASATWPVMCRVAINPPLPPLTTHTPLCPPCQERKRKVAGDVPGGDQPDKPAKTSGSSAQQVSEGLRWGGTEVWGVQTSRRSKCERDRHR